MNFGEAGRHAILSIQLRAKETRQERHWSWLDTSVSGQAELKSCACPLLGVEP
jgi:hypothetical protein